MNFEEYAAKPRLAEVGITVPASKLVLKADAAQAAAREIGKCVVKAQVPTGKRGKAGGIKLAADHVEARSHADTILGMDINGHRVQKLLIEAQTEIARELYAAVLNDADTKSPMIMFSTEGGMDIEEVSAASPEKLLKCAVDIRRGFGADDARSLLAAADLGEHSEAVAQTLVKLYQAYIDNDAEMLEINPLVITSDGGVVALDCKYVMDDSAIKRHEALAAEGTPDRLSGLEAKGEALGLKYIELDGDVAVLANGAGLTMTTMDVVRHHGGNPANFCEIGGQAYTLAKPALELVLSKPGVKSLVVNFCGAFARCDVMMEGLLAAWKELTPDFPVFFSIAGTGDEKAIAMLERELGMTPLENMGAACAAAVQAARERPR